ncbi:SMP-30/gluconolactonase/LRE family protein [Chelatococcus sp. GCM10030263]|uniref:SMP-30/gluconolactonase/LRE family protein n=1 Tax=Chelatococcus sp. GCM10030263 TaxID=3273387 RepID=UPI003617CA4F
MHFLQRDADLRVVARIGDVLGESPTWVGSTEHLYWVDLRRPALRRLDPSGRVETWPMPEVAAAVVPRRSGGVVLALKTGLHAFDPENGALTFLATVEEGQPENRLNDAKCDAAGRLWCGSMWDYGLETTGSLYRIDAERRVTRMRDGVTVPNAIAFSPDGRTLYFADTRRGAIERTDFDPATGEIGPWRVFAPADAAPGRPDGATVDAEGFLWNARYGGGCLARFAPDGRLDRIVQLPVTQPTSCAFGGPGLATLFVTTATQRLDAYALQQQPLAGSLLAVDVGVAGLPEPAFAG